MTKEEKERKELTAKTIKLKPCPICGERDIEVKEVSNPTVVWDSAMRGEHGYAICCYECGLSVKSEYRCEAIENWNIIPRRRGKDESIN